MNAIYDRIGVGYADLRRPDPRIAQLLADALGGGSIVNVGAGAGSYEPPGTTAAVEPSPVMLAQRPATAAPAVQAVAEALPFRDGQFDAALASLTTHHWTDPRTGLEEMARVSGRQVVLTWDAEYTAEHFWVLTDYLPEAGERELDLAEMRTVLEVWPDATAVPVMVPHDCTDGFFAAYWRRPEAYLVPAVRDAISGLALLDQQLVAEAMERLRSDLDDGSWARRHADLLEKESHDCGYRLVIRDPCRSR